MTLDILQPPTGKTHAIIMQDYRKCKNKTDRKMVKALNNVSSEERHWGHGLALIDKKQKLGLGLVVSRRAPHLNAHEDTDPCHISVAGRVCQPVRGRADDFCCFNNTISP